MLMKASEISACSYLPDYMVPSSVFYFVLKKISILAGDCSVCDLGLLLVRIWEELPAGYNSRYFSWSFLVSTGKSSGNILRQATTSLDNLRINKLLRGMFSTLPTCHVPQRMKQRVVKCVCVCVYCATLYGTLIPCNWMAVPD